MPGMILFKVAKKFFEYNNEKYAWGIKLSFLLSASFETGA